MDNFIKTNDPNDRWGAKILEITLMQWKYVGHIYCLVCGNCSGKDVLDFADFETDDFIENPKDFKLEYDESNDIFTYELHDSEGNVLSGEGEPQEMNEMIVSIRLVEKIPDELSK